MWSKKIASVAKLVPQGKQKKGALTKMPKGGKKKGRLTMTIRDDGKKNGWPKPKKNADW